MAARTLDLKGRTHGRVATYGVGCRCPECREVWRVYYLTRQRDWRKANPEKFAAQKQRANAARRKKIKEERLRAGDAKD